MHLPCLRSVSHSRPSLVTSCCWSLSSWPAGWPLSVQQNPMITPSHYPHTGRLTAFHWECFKRPLEFLFTLTLYSCLLFSSHGCSFQTGRYRKAPLIVIATSEILIWNWIICPIYPLTMSISLNNKLFPAAFVVVVTTQTVNRCSFSILNRDRHGNHRVNELSSQVLCEMFSCNVWACTLQAGVWKI